jgi:outer membrane lipoprotein-sorting protein
MKLTWSWPWAILVVALGLFTAGPWSAWGQEPQPSSAATITVPLLLQHIETKAKSLKSLSGRFQQAKLTRLLAVPMESEGTFYWQPPDRFRWEVTSPASFTVVAQSDTVLVHYGDLNRANLYRHPAGNGLLGQIIGTAGDPEQFKRTYSMQITAGMEAADHHWIQLQMEPQTARQARTLKRIEVLIDPTSWLPQKVMITETSGDWSSIRLHDLVENADMAESLFSVNPPEGVETRQFMGSGRP